MASRAHKRKDVTEEEWREISRVLNQTEHNLSQLLVDKLQFILLRQDYDNLTKAMRYLSLVKSKCENEMFKQGIEDINIFYPGQKR